ncbi:MAG TPA: pitrilysin family protein [Clostridia bacterium]|nr:pitrilysin family protein [Clostridia bacterium]
MSIRYCIALLLAGCLTAFAADAAPKPKPAPGPATVLLPTRSPLITFRLLFNTGSASDPQGKEGLASLTAAMLSDAGSRTMTYAQINEAMYPMATSFNSQVDKEMSVFVGTTHSDNLERYYTIIRDMVLDPGFREDDFQRVKTDAVNFLKVTLRSSNDEELGKEVLYTMIYPPTHPYGHVNAGRVSTLEKLTLDDVRNFYKQHYTQAALVVGLAGAYPKGFEQRVVADFRKLPAGKAQKVNAAAPAQKPGMQIQIVQRQTRSTAISLGFPIDQVRGQKDWPALAVVASYLGQHRSSSSYLYQQLRELRGLNYGDYAYVEYFPQGMYRFEPAPNLGRRSQIFQIWIRPVDPKNGLFTLRAALYEYDKLVKNGMSKETFESTREFLGKYANVLTQTQDAQLGYALDSNFYGTPEFPQYMREQLSRLTLEDVNRAIKKYLKSDAMRIAIVTEDAEGLRKGILSNLPSPVTYTSPKPQSVLEEDKTIQAYTIPAKDADVKVVPAEQVFE